MTKEKNMERAANQPTRKGSSMGGMGYLALDLEAAKEAHRADLEFYRAILIPYEKRVTQDGVVVQESDYARVPRRVKVKGRWVTEYVDAPKRSAFRKLARFYNVCTEITEKTKERHGDGSYSWHYTVRASARNGVYTEGDGSCTSTEKVDMREHDVRATAHVRAENRAISGLLGFGQVSAEEFTGIDGPPKRVMRRQLGRKVPSQGEVKTTGWGKSKSKGEKMKKGQVAGSLPGPGVENITMTLEVNGLRVDGYLEVIEAVDKVHIRPPKDIEENAWSRYEAVLVNMNASWNEGAHRWEVPCK